MLFGSSVFIGLLAGDQSCSDVALAKLRKAATLELVGGGVDK